MSLSDSPAGHRGYIASRPVAASRTPQHVQNLVIRDYAARNGLRYKLSVTEHAMANCFMQLRLALDELPRLDGLIAYSLFMMPAAFSRRDAVFREVVEAGKSLHFAVEQVVLQDQDDIGVLHQLWRISQAMGRQDMSGLRAQLLRQEGT